MDNWINSSFIDLNGQVDKTGFQTHENGQVDKTDFQTHENGQVYKTDFQTHDNSQDTNYIFNI